MGARRRRLGAGDRLDVRAAALAFLAGVLAVHTLTALPPLWWFLPAFLACLLRWPGRVLVLVALVGAAWTVWQAQGLLAARLPAALDGSQRVLTGHIAGIPEDGAFRARFQFESDGEPHRVRLSWYGEARPALAAGDCWRLTVKLSAPHGSLNPGGFDYESWLWRERIGATGYVRAAEPCPRELSPASRLARWRQAAVKDVREALDGHRMTGIITALTLGDQSRISDHQWQVLRRTGTAHLVSISGLHIALMAGLLFAGLRWLLPRLLPAAAAYALPVAAVGAMSAAVVYAAMAGFALATQRSLVMVLVVLVAVCLRRRTAPSRLLALALLAVLVLDPFAVLSPGLWLSFGAVAWILYLVSGRIQAQRWRLWVWLQLALVLGLMPLSLYWFGEASLAAPLANAVLIPASVLIVPAALAAVAAALALPFLGAPLLGWLADGLATGWVVLEWLAQVPLAWFSLPAPTTLSLLLALAGAALLLAPRGVPGRWLGLLGLLPLLLAPPAPPPGGYTLTVLDVGQGLAAVVRTHNHVLLFDAGPRYRTGFDAGEALVLPYLQARGLTRLDLVVISHGDSDHAGGWPAVRAALPVAAAMGAETATPCRAGRHWRWDGVDFAILNPVAGAAAVPDQRSDNNASCVLLVAGDGGRALLAGDIEAEAEAALLARAAPRVAADVVVVPHHGSASSSTAAFVAAVAPDYAVVSAGWHNRWGFPAAEVVARYRAVGARVLETGTLGAIRFDFHPQAGLLGPFSWRQRVGAFWHLPLPR